MLFKCVIVIRKCKLLYYLFKHVLGSMQLKWNWFNFFCAKYFIKVMVFLTIYTRYSFI